MYTKTHFIRRQTGILVAWILMAGINAHGQVIRYVAPAGAGSINGTDWDNAYGVAGLQTAVNDAVAGGAGSIVYLKEGPYSLTAQLSVSSAAGLTISGGWAGNGTGGLPGTQGSTGTILRRDPGVTTNRIINAANSTLTITNLTITDGYLKSATGGAGMYLSNCQTILANSRVVSNRLGTTTLYGMGIYATGGSLTLHNSEISGNSDQGDAWRVDGGGLYATSVNIAATNVVFADNNIVANSESYGGGVFLNAGNARFVNCEFRNNRIRAGSGGQTKRGGGLYAQNVVSLVLTNCVLTGNAVNNYIVEGGTIYVSGAGATEIVNTRIDGNAYQHPADLYFLHGDDLYLNVTGPVSLRHTEITSGSLRGIYKAGAGSLSMTNCLVGGQSSHGIQTVAGAITIAHSTIAGNGGWGLTNSGATVTLSDSILWNNRLGGISTNGLTMTTTCNQDGHAGTGNFAADPTFAAGYRLSVNGLTGQTADSPCINVGSRTAAAAGLDARTTRTDGTADSGTVDLGYHYANAASGLENLTLFVDVNSGDNLDSGHSWEDALKSIRAALAKAVDGSTIHIAAGTYTTTNETFPLTIPYSGITLKGTNRNATIINAAGSGRLFEITGKAGVTFDGLTLTNGVVTGDGAGLKLINSLVTLTNCVVTDHRCAGGAAQYGMGIYAGGGTLTIRNSILKQNRDSDGYAAYGGAIYAKEVGLTMKGTLLENNRVGANNPYYGGGALHLVNGWALLSDCTFSTNYMRFTSAATYYGGCIYATNANPLSMDGCTFTGNYADGRTASYGGVLYRDGAGTTGITNCFFGGNVNMYSGEDIYFNTTGPAYIRDTVITGGSKHGIYKAGAGSLSLSNVLIAGQPQHGILAATGTLTLVNVTLANNAGWGLTNTAATVSLLDSIFRGNARGGVTANGLTMTYTCNQDGRADSGNFDTDPLFKLGYYLSVNGQPGQSADSPCINAGSRTAAAAGLDTRTTRTDGTADSGTVDLGYHYANAASGLENLTLFVDVNSGDNLDSGHRWEDALKSISAALAKAVDGSTIHIAAGIYTTTNETFPLTIPYSGITLKGTNRNATIINAAGTNRLLSISGKVGVQIEGLTFTNGVVSSANGAGMMLISSQTTLTNCVLTDCRVPVGTTYGVGIYAAGGTLTILDSVLKNQRDEDGLFAYGGAIYAQEVGLTMKRTLLENNRVGANNAYSGGGALHLVNGWASLSDCTFSTNYMRYTGFTPTYYGGCIYATGVNPLSMDGCTFTGNYADGRGGSQGGVIFRAGGGVTEITNCFFGANVNINSGEDIYFNTTGPAYIRDTVITGGSKHGIYKAGAGSLSLTNVLIAGQPQHGILAAAGALTLANVTLASNTGWGLTNTAATVNLLDSILWGNARGGVTTNGLTMTYSCNQDGRAGTGNVGGDPLFTLGYYLSVNGQPGQSADSPCINAGSRTATVAGLDSRTTRTDGVADGGTVDLGYHYAGPAEGLANLTLFVDVNSGDNLDSGHSWEDALKSISAALAKAVDGSTIHIAAGTYTTTYETFPLTIPSSGITLRGTNRASTVINANASSRVLSISGKTGVRIEGLSFTNGYVAGNGAGISSINSAVLVTNCTVSGNRTSGVGVNRDGIGVYISGGAFEMVDGELIGNRYTENVVYQGGGLYASGANVTLRRVTVAGNTTLCNWDCSGAGVFLSSGQANISECTFTSNGIELASPGQTHSGGAIYASAVNPLLLTNCLFTGNYALGSIRKGGVMYLGGAGLSARIVDCVVSNNATANSSDDIYIESTGTVMIDRTIITGGVTNGIHMVSAGTLTLTNSLVHSYTLHGVRVAAGTVSISSSTFANNLGWGVTNSAGTVTVKNSVVWGNAQGGITGATVSYTDSQEVNAGTGNLNTDPFFKDAGVFDFSLKPGSPCVNAGDNEDWMETGFDLAGAKRRISARVDMGAFESSGAQGSIFSIR